jgi:lysophospholipase L1-like esterase
MPDSELNRPGALTERGKRNLAISIVVAATLLMLLGAEAAVRLRQMLKYGSATIADGYYMVDSSIKLRVPVPGFSNGRISVNSLGFRGPEITMPKPPGTVRLAFLGASTTWCAEVSGNDFVWSHLVSQSLGRVFPGAHFDYVNGSLPGYSISALLRNLRYRVAPLAPDVIVIYEAANDLSGELRKLAEEQGLVAEAKMGELTWPSRYSLLWNLVEKNLRVLKAQHDAKASSGRLVVNAAALGREYRQDLTELVLAARKTSKLVAVATFSIHPRREQPAGQQLAALTSAIFYTPFVTPTTIIEGYERYNQIAREVARETGADLIEGEYDIPGDSAHFADTVHFTDAGSEAMAQRISRALVANPALRTLVSEKAAGR